MNRRCFVIEFAFHLRGTLHFCGARPLAIADALGADKFVTVGHDMGSGVAFRCALKFPDRVVGVIGLSAPYFVEDGNEDGAATDTALDDIDPDNFFYIRWMHKPDEPEAELDRDPRGSIKQIFWLVSGDAPPTEFLKQRPSTNTMLQDLLVPPEGPLSFMDDAILDRYGDAFEKGGFFGPVNWYRCLADNARGAASYGGCVLLQPAAYISGEHETALVMLPGIVERQRRFLPNLKLETVLPGVGHWVQQEAPEETNRSILNFLDEAKPFENRA